MGYLCFMRVIHVMEIEYGIGIDCIIECVMFDVCNGCIGEIMRLDWYAIVSEC